MRGVVVTLVASLATFCVVQDRMTADGARRYVRMQREAMAANTPANVTVDEVMTPATREGVTTGLLSAVGILLTGFLVVVLWSTRD